MIDFRSAPDVIENNFTPNERQDALERSRRAVLSVKDLVIETLLRMLSELKNCKSLEDFKRYVILPILIELIGLSVKEVIRLIFATIF